MKVLTRTADSPDVRDVLTTGWMGMRPISVSVGAKSDPILEGFVADWPESKIAAALRSTYIEEGAIQTGSVTEMVAEEMRDLRRFSKLLAPADVGVKVELKPTKSGALTVKLPREESPDLAEGDTVAFNCFCSPKYLLNTRGVVLEVKGKKALIEVDQGDLARLQKAGRDRFQAKVNAPLTILDKVA